jgi:hypothetical protein
MQAVIDSYVPEKSDKQMCTLTKATNERGIQPGIQHHMYMCVRGLLH